MSKNTHGYQNYILHYNNIRKMLRHYYKYGSYSLKDFIKHLSTDQEKFSESKLRSIQKRITNYIDTQYIADHKLPNRTKDKKAYRIKYDPFMCPINFLADTYQYRSYVQEDFYIYFLLMQAFSPDGENGFFDSNDKNGFSKENFLDYIIDHIEDSYGENDEGFDYANPLSEQFIQKFDNKLDKHLEDMVDAGFLVLSDQKLYPRLRGNREDNIAYTKDEYMRLKDKTGFGRPKKLYKLAPDIFQSIDEINSLITYVQFFYNQSVLCIPGYFLYSTLSSYEIYAKKKIGSLYTEQENPVFIYRHNNLHNVLDNDVMWSILNCMSKKQPIAVYYTKHNMTKNMTIYPLKIVSEQMYGRQYLFAYDYKAKKMVSKRLDVIDSVAPAADVKNIFEFLPENAADIDEALSSYYKAQTKYIWNVNFFGDRYHILIHFRFPAKQAGQLESRLRSTCRHGLVTSLGTEPVTGDVLYDFEIDTYNFTEIKPWILGFGAYAAVDQEASPELYESMKQSYREVLKKYGIVQ